MKRRNSMKPVFKEPKKELTEKVNESVRLEIEKVKAEIEAKADERIKVILLEREEKTKKEKAEKIQEAVNAAKYIKDDSDKSKEGIVATVEEAKHDHKDDGISCPGCKRGHVHKADDKSGLVYRCTKDGCGYEAIMVAKQADYKCNNCSMPIKKPEKPEDIDGCPFCGSTKAVRFDWQKLWNVKKK